MKSIKLLFAHRAVGRLLYPPGKSATKEYPPKR